MFLSQSDKEILDDFVPWQKHEGLFDTAHKIVIKLICSASILIQQVRQLNGITQRIDLIFRSQINHSSLSNRFDARRHLLLH